MKIRGVEVAFEIDNISDNERFIKAHGLMAKKTTQNKANFGLADMKAFIQSCLPKEAFEELTKDNKISTIVSVFTEFFENCIAQQLALNEVYSKVNDKFKNIIENSENIIKPLAELGGDDDVAENSANTNNPV